MFLKDRRLLYTFKCIEDISRESEDGGAVSGEARGGSLREDGQCLHLNRRGGKRAFLVAQMIHSLPAVQEIWV